MKRILIAAVSRNNIIAVNNRIPWSVPSEMSFFKNITTNKWHIDHTNKLVRKSPPLWTMMPQSSPSPPVVIMGRRTHESIPRKLTSRHSIVVSSRLHASTESCDDVVKSVDAAIYKAYTLQATHVYILGGFNIYAECLERRLCHQLLISRMHLSVPLEGTTDFVEMPPINTGVYRLDGIVSFGPHFDLEVYNLRQCNNTPQ